MSKMCVTLLRLMFHRQFVFCVVLVLQMYVIILNIQNLFLLPY